MLTRNETMIASMVMVVVMEQAAAVDAELLMAEPFVQAGEVGKAQVAQEGGGQVVIEELP